MRVLKPLGVSLFLLFVSQIAEAVSSFDVLGFRPSPDLGGYLSVLDSRTHERRRYNLHFFLEYENRPLQLTTGTTRVDGIIDNLLVGHLGGAVGILRWLEVGADIPTVFVNKQRGKTGVNASAGDVHLFTKFRVWDIERHKVGVAAAPFINLPSGSTSDFVGNGNVSGGVKLAAEFHPTEKLNLALNLGVLIRERVVRFGTEANNSMTAGIGMDVQLFRYWYSILEITGMTPFDDFLKRSVSSPTEVDVGVRHFFKNGLVLTVGGGAGILNGVGSSRFKGFASLGFQDFRSPHVSLSKEAKIAQEVVEIYELFDRCPIDVGRYRVSIDDRRCTEIYELQQIAEACPEQGSFNVQKDNPTCLTVYALEQRDADLDGVPDFLDWCPTEVGGKGKEGCSSKAYATIILVEKLQSIAETCPEEGMFNPKQDNPDCPQVYTLKDKDTDQDGIPDFLDRCPTEPGDRDKGGCPSRTQLATISTESQILGQKIYFDFDKAVIRPDALPILDHLVKVILSHPSIVLVSIEGHTDEIGTAEKNQSLSILRAKMVYRYLMDHGVSREKVIYNGYGKSRPLVKTKTEEGHAQNRRVEFVIRKD